MGSACITVERGRAGSGAGTSVLRQRGLMGHWAVDGDMAMGDTYPLGFPLIGAGPHGKAVDEGLLGRCQRHGDGS